MTRRAPTETTTDLRQPRASDATDALAPPGQRVFSISGAQLGLDGRDYAPPHELGPSGEAASPHLGPPHGVSYELGQDPTEAPSPPVRGQLRLNLKELDATPQLDVWERLEQARELLRNDEHGSRSRDEGRFDRQAKCMHVRRVKRDEDVIVRRHESDAFTVHGLVRCGMWSCPSCGPQRARSTSSTLAVAFQRHLSRDVFTDVWMLTLAPPHELADDPTTSNARLFEATAQLFVSAEWRTFAKRWGIDSRVRVLDITHGGPNGMHPHFHVALFVDRAAMPVDDEDADLLPWQPARGQTKQARQAWLDGLHGALSDAWLRICESVGVPIRNPTAFRSFALRLSPAESAQSYFLKWGLADEIGAPTAKHRSHLRLLDGVRAGVRGAASAFLAFRFATDGRQWVTGLADVARRFNVTGDDVRAHQQRIREARDAELAAKGTPATKVTPLVLTIRPHLYAGVIAATWPAVFAMLRALPVGADHQDELERFLWRARLDGRRRRDHGPAP